MKRKVGKCLVDGCTAAVDARGYCPLHMVRYSGAAEVDMMSEMTAARQVYEPGARAIPGSHDRQTEARGISVPSKDLTVGTPSGSPGIGGNTPPGMIFGMTPPRQETPNVFKAPSTSEKKGDAVSSSPNKELDRSKQGFPFNLLADESTISTTESEVNVKDGKGRAASPVTELAQSLRRSSIANETEAFGTPVRSPMRKDSVLEGSSALMDLFNSSQGPSVSQPTSVSNSPHLQPSRPASAVEKKVAPTFATPTGRPSSADNTRKPMATPSPVPQVAAVKSETPGSSTGGTPNKMSQEERVKAVMDIVNSIKPVDSPGSSKSKSPAQKTPKGFSLEQRTAMERVFSVDKNPGMAIYTRLAEQLGLRPRQVQKWFENKRLRSGKTQEGTGRSSPMPTDSPAVGSGTKKKPSPSVKTQVGRITTEEDKVLASPTAAALLLQMSKDSPFSRKSAADDSATQSEEDGDGEAESDEDEMAGDQEEDEPMSEPVVSPTRRYGKILRGGKQTDAVQLLERRQAGYLVSYLVSWRDGTTSWEPGSSILSETLVEALEKRIGPVDNPAFESGQRSVENLRAKYAMMPQAKNSPKLLNKSPSSMSLGTTGKQTFLYTHPACLNHVTPHYHIEAPARLERVLQALSGDQFKDIPWKAAPCASIDLLYKTHSRRYIDSFFQMSSLVETGGVVGLVLDPPENDTFISPGTREAVLRAAGSVTAAIDDVMAGKCRNAFCAVRPPGHHCESKRPNGFCMLNNAAVGAVHANLKHGLKRVAVMDFDVHHGNGTQDLLQKRSCFFYASIHRAEIFPNTGLSDDTGKHNNVINCPVSSRVGRQGVRREMAKVISALDAYKPDLLIISAGFDAHKDDPQQHALGLGEKDFQVMTRELMQVAERHCGGRVVSVLEGGYNLEALVKSVCLHVNALRGAAGDEMSSSSAES